MWASTLTNLNQGITTDKERANRWRGIPTRFLAHRRSVSRGRTPAGRGSATCPRRGTGRSRWRPFGSVSLSNSYHTHTQNCSRSWHRSLRSYTGLRHIHPHPFHTWKEKEGPNKNKQTRKQHDKHYCVEHRFNLPQGCTLVKPSFRQRKKAAATKYHLLSWLLAPIANY